MSPYRYPFRHSTFFTNTDNIWTSELPVSTPLHHRILGTLNNTFSTKQPMNSTEDILQDMFMRDRSRKNIASAALLILKPKPKSKVKSKGNNNNSKKGFKKAVKFITVSPAFN